MPLPYQFRDYPLAVFMLGAAVVTGFLSFTNADGRETMITVLGDCCDSSRCPVVDSLSPVLSSRVVTHRRDGATTTISLRTTQSACPRLVWDTVATTNLGPLRLVVDGQEFVDRPQY